MNLSTLKPLFLDDILGKVRLNTAALKTQLSLSACRNLAAAQTYKPRDLTTQLKEARPHIIAEIKFASPSLGTLRAGYSTDFSAEQIAKQYLESGASALSVLTQAVYFKGSPDYIAQIRSSSPSAYILMKDFILEEYQLYLARAMGADAVLLIVSILGMEKCHRLFDVASKLGLSVLLEVHTAEEIHVAAALGAPVIGVNNRDLHDQKVKPETAHRLIELAPATSTLIAESGISSATEIRTLYAIGYRGFLMGTHFMMAPYPGAALKSLISELTEGS